MAKKTQTETARVDFTEVARVIEPTPLQNLVESSFLSYAYTVILDRALPDVRDGLKPVQRRILYSMMKDGVTPDKNHVKSARIVGNCMGAYHPHGDSSIYEAMVRLARGFSLNIPLIDGHGNFGTGPGDGAAASRYTESRLAKEALLMLEDIKEEATDFLPNYDGTEQEPVVLPARIPNLLINGGSGIAVGMATKSAPHNAGEAMDAASYLLDNPDATVDDLMKYIPGPDLPTGGIIVGQDAIKQAYETGRGVFRIRGKYEIESLPRGKSNIVFTEMPYDVSIVKVIKDIKDGIEEGNLQGVADVKDLTDRVEGTRLRIETKAGVNPERLAGDLFTHTALEVSFGINNVVIYEDRPVVMGLKEILQAFLNHRVEVITRRTKFRLDKRQDRLHILAGLLKALLDIDKAIAIIRAAKDTDTAKKKLITAFKVDETQAEYILSLQLRRLTRFDQEELETEQKKLLDEVAELEKIIAEPATLKRVLSDELKATKAIIDHPRRSELLDGSLAEHRAELKETLKSESVEVADEPCIIRVYASGMVDRTEENKRIPRRGSIEPVVTQLVTTTRSHIILVTNQGRAFRVEALHVPEKKVDATALDIALSPDEFIVAVGKNEYSKDEAGLALGTRSGIVKILACDFPLRSDDFPVMGLADGDTIIGGGWVGDPNETDLVFVSEDTSLLRFNATKVRPQGRTGGGVAGIKLGDGLSAVAFSVAPLAELDTLRAVTFTGVSVKTSELALFPVKGRATGGVRSHTLRKGEEKLVAAFVGPRPLMVNEGSALELPEPVKRDASGTEMVVSEVTIGIDG